MDAKKLKHFIRLAETNSFHEAAKLLSISQPALSKSIKSLEEQLGLTLFERTSRKLELTEIGKALLPQARIAVLKVDNIQQIAKQHLDSENSSLNLGIGPYPSKSVITPVLEKFINKNQRVKFNVVVDDPERLAKSLVNGLLDVIVVDENVKKMSNEIKFSSLRPRPVSIFCNHKHPFADRTDLQLSDLYEFPVTFLSSIARYVMNKRIIGIDFSENFITTNSPDMVIQLVKGTNTIGILIHEDIEPFVRDGTFVTLNVQEIQQDLYSRFGVAVNSSVVSSKTTERFITELVEFDKKTYE